MICDQGIIALAETLKENKSLVCLDISKKKFFYLGHNLYGLKGSEAITQTLKQNRSLSSINISASKFIKKYK